MDQYNTVILTICIVYVYAHFTDVEVKDLNRGLNLAEEKILRILQEPKIEDGDTLMETFDKYNQQLAQLVSLINEDGGTFNAASLLCARGGPSFLKIKLDNDMIKSKLNFTEEHIQEIYNFMGATDVLWFELKQLDPKGEHFMRLDNFTKEDINVLHGMDKDNKLNDLLEFTKMDDFQRTDTPPVNLAT